MTDVGRGQWRSPISGIAVRQNKRVVGGGSCREKTHAGSPRDRWRYLVWLMHGRIDLTGWKLPLMDRDRKTWKAWALNNMHRRKCQRTAKTMQVESQSTNLELKTNPKMLSVCILRLV